MDQIALMLLGNAVIALALALAAILAGLLRRPAVAHALWVLLLLKLITPPLLAVPVRWGAATEAPHAVSTALPRTAIATASSTPSPPSVILTPVTPTNVTVEHRDRSRLPLNWLPILMTSWTCGSVVFAAIAG